MNRQTRPSQLTGTALAHDAEVFLIEADVIRDGKREPYFAERDSAQTGRADTIADIVAGQVENVRRVYCFNPFEGWSRDVSEDMARDVLACALHEGGTIQRDLREFLEQHLGCDCVATA